jgi:hypothetical protein
MRLRNRQSFSPRCLNLCLRIYISALLSRKGKQSGAKAHIDNPFEFPSTKFAKLEVIQDLAKVYACVEDECRLNLGVE